MFAEPDATLARRLFLALFPPADVVAELEASRKRWTGLPPVLRPLPEHLHLTLQFLGRVPAEQEQQLHDALADLRFAPFELCLRRLECWHPRRRALVVARADTSLPLMTLQQRVGQLCTGIGHAPDSRPWKPHLTLLHRAYGVRFQTLDAPLCWQVDTLDLVWSDLRGQMPRYVLVKRFHAI